MVRCRAGHRGEHCRPQRRRGRSRGRGHRTAVRRTCQAIEGCHQNCATCIPPNCSVRLAPGCRTCLSCAATALLARARGAVKFLVLGVAVARHGSDVVARGLPKRRVLEELPSDVCGVRLHRALAVAYLTSSPHRGAKVVVLKDSSCTCGEFCWVYSCTHIEPCNNRHRLRQSAVPVIHFGRFCYSLTQKQIATVYACASLRSCACAAALPPP